jgi:endoglucanase Acf2
MVTVKAPITRYAIICETRSPVGTEEAAVKKTLDCRFTAHQMYKHKNMLSPALYDVLLESM